jgi:hypothetical protein
MPDGTHLLRFWLAGPLTLLIFIPALFAGVFGAPLMLPGLYLAYRMLRAGKDGYDDFAIGGFQVGLVALCLSVPFGYAPLFAFGLLFGPLMAMCFRWIAGRWRPAPPNLIRNPAGYPLATTPALARVPRTA